jgi:tryptophan synthase alpha chain
VTIQRIEEAFARLKADNRKALIPYITSGFPERDLTVDVMHAMVRAFF